MSIELLKQLRERTSASMLECKKALVEASNDIDAACTILRKAGQARADKKSQRIAAEGIVSIKLDTSRHQAFILEVNCESDFAARDTEFISFVEQVATHGLAIKSSSLEEFLQTVVTDGQTVTDLRNALVAKIGENINVRRINMLSVPEAGLISSYIHGNGRIGVLVGLSINNKELGHDIAMHIAACKPEAIDATDLPQELLQKEKEIYMAEVAATGKPAPIMEKIVAGKMQKFISEVILLKQPFIKNPDLSVGDLLQQSGGAGAKVLGFIRFAVGEGVTKKTSDFAAEVEAQVALSRGE